jgi:hypothetical protein
MLLQSNHGIPVTTSRLRELNAGGTTLRKKCEREQNRHLRHDPMEVNPIETLVDDFDAGVEYLMEINYAARVLMEAKGDNEGISRTSSSTCTILPLSVWPIVLANGPSETNSNSNASLLGQQSQPQSTRISAPTRSASTGSTICSKIYRHCKMASEDHGTTTQPRSFT